MNKIAKNLVFSSLCTAIGVLLPSFFHMFGLSGTIFLPMHLPVLICGFICGWQYGILCGVLVPLLSSSLTGMPPLFPIAISMMIELGTYGALTGLLYKKLHLFPSLILSMLGGRIMNGLANILLLGLAGKPYTLNIFISSSFITSLPGIVIQLIFIPIIISLFQKSGYMENKKIKLKHWSEL